MTMEQLNKQMEQYQKGTLEHCIGMELLELCKGNEGASEIVEQDLAKEGDGSFGLCKEDSRLCQKPPEGRIF